MTGPESPSHTVAVVLAGGAGLRVGGSVPKQLIELAGRPIIEHSIATFDRARDIGEVLVVMAAEFVDEVETIVDAGAYHKVTRVIAGGSTRNASTMVAIEALGDRRCDVLFHDAARPLVDGRIVADCVRTLRTREAACTAVPATDTVLVVDDGNVTDIPDRRGLWRCQTPQGFRLPVIRRAYELAMADPDFADGRAATTDDCGVLRRYLPEVPARVVRGSERNMKVTHPVDLYVAEGLARGVVASADPPASGESR